MANSALYPAKRNMVIGGNADTNPFQRGYVFTSPVDGTRCADMWVWRQSGPGAVEVSRAVNVIPPSQTGLVTTQCFKHITTTADATLAATSQYSIQNTIEGYDYAQFAQSPYVVSFWHFASDAGTYCVALHNTDDTQSYVAEYTHVTPGVWEYASLVIPPPASTTGWNLTNLTGLKVIFSLGAGTNFQTTPGTWQSGNFYATSNQFNVLGATPRNLELQLVQVRPGTQAQSWEPRAVAEELKLCQRYFTSTFQPGVTPATAIGLSTGNLIWPATRSSAVSIRSQSVNFNMRAAPTITTYNPVNNNAQVYDDIAASDCSGTTPFNVNANSLNIVTTGAAGTTAGDTLQVHFTAEAGLQFT